MRRRPLKSRVRRDVLRQARARLQRERRKWEGTAPQGSAALLEQEGALDFIEFELDEHFARVSSQLRLDPLSWARIRVHQEVLSSRHVLLEADWVAQRNREGVTTSSQNSRFGLPFRQAQHNAVFEYDFDGAIAEGGEVAETRVY